MGRRPQDQFCVYVFERFVLPTLSRKAIAAASAGTRRLDEDVQANIRTELSYRRLEAADGAEAYKIEAALVT